MARINPNLLLVEGDTDKRVIPEFMEQNGVKPWANPSDSKNYVVDIETLKSSRDKSNFNKSFNNQETIEKIITYLKQRRRSALGIIRDSDCQPQNEWESVKNACQEAIKKYYNDQYPDSSIPELPKTLPEEGLIITLENNIKFGIWMMPDNKSEGMLETFLSYLLPSETDTLWLYTQQVVDEAKRKGASYKDVHKDKALIYTWLAWEDEPGRQLHQAIAYKILDAKHPRGQAFVKWFKSLYSLH